MKKGKGNGSFRVLLFHSWWGWAEQAARSQPNQVKTTTAILLLLSARKLHFLTDLLIVQLSHQSWDVFLKLSLMLTACELRSYKSRESIVVCSGCYSTKLKTHLPVEIAVTISLPDDGRLACFSLSCFGKFVVLGSNQSPCIHLLQNMTL